MKTEMKAAVAFGVGLLGGVALAVAIWTFWKEPELPYKNNALYNVCLFNKTKEACDALMRFTQRPTEVRQ